MLLWIPDQVRNEVLDYSDSLRSAPNHPLTDNRTPIAPNTPSKVSSVILPFGPSAQNQIAQSACRVILLAAATSVMPFARATSFSAVRISAASFSSEDDPPSSC
jgi:hypothetical protein